MRHEIWENDTVAWWYWQNPVACVRESRVGDFPAAIAATWRWPTDVVNPRAYVVATVLRGLSLRGRWTC